MILLLPGKEPHLEFKTPPQSKYWNNDIAVCVKPLMSQNIFSYDCYYTS
jgi:hypothetical protein